MMDLDCLKALDHASYEFNCDASYSYFKLHVNLSLILLMYFAIGFCCFPCFWHLVMAPKVGRKFKTRANRNPGSSSSGLTLCDKKRFLSSKCEETYETLTKYRSIWCEREIVLSELDPSICRNFVSRNWVSLCEVFDLPPAVFVRTYVIYLLGTYVTVLCNWLILW